MSLETIDSKLLASLVEAGAVQSAHVIGRAGGWGVMVDYGKGERVLTAQRSHKPREFKKLDTVVAFLKELGLSRFDVDAANYDPDQVERVARPDRAEALKQAHEAAAYDKWLRKKVQESIEDPRPGIPHEQVKAEWAIERAELLKRAGKVR